MTGRYPMRCGQSISRHSTEKYKNYALHPDEVTMAEQLKKAGGNKKKRFTTLAKPVLYDLNSDLAEKNNLYAENPEVVKELNKEADRIRKEIGDVNVIGTDQRPHGLKNSNEKQ